ncbi:GNAT family N-acetyltransferase [Paraclostridium sordellii]|uniref:GNAT family N-acetyltransferase n=1 Tax=Paraclostridium sordellii TaxID=1505 RepID=UPI0022E85D63|nr:GNAT family protein [Paeniclostridium sordellii]
MLKHIGTKTINTDRLVLRRFEINDANDMFKNWASDKEVSKFLAWDVHKDVIFTQLLLDSWISQYSDDRNYHWAIELKEIKEVIGDIKVFHLKDKHACCEIGYCLSREHWNKGFMSEALNAVIKYLFEEIGLNRIVAMHNTKNIASGKVMIKNNMKYEGTLRQAVRLNDTFYDLSIYSILKSEWNA